MPQLNLNCMYRFTSFCVIYPVSLYFLPCFIIHYLFQGSLSVPSSHIPSLYFPSPLFHHYTHTLSNLSLQAHLLCLSSLSCLSLLPCHLHSVIFVIHSLPFSVSSFCLFGKNRLVHWGFHQTAVGGDLSYQQWSFYVFSLHVPAEQHVCDRAR